MNIAAAVNHITLILLVHLRVARSPLHISWLITWFSTLIDPYRTLFLSKLLLLLLIVWLVKVRWSLQDLRLLLLRVVRQVVRATVLVIRVVEFYIPGLWGCIIVVFQGRHQVLRRCRWIDYFAAHLVHLCARLVQSEVFRVTSHVVWRLWLLARVLVDLMIGLLWPDSVILEILRLLGFWMFVSGSKELVFLFLYWWESRRLKPALARHWNGVCGSISEPARLFFSEIRHISVKSCSCWWLGPTLVIHRWHG